jgi:hypothetical protein
VKLTGGQIVAEYLAREGVPYVLAIPGHGNAALLDAFVDRDDVEVLPVVHEQCGVHVATLTTASPGGRWSSAPNLHQPRVALSRCFTGLPQRLAAGVHDRAAICSGRPL